MDTAAATGPVLFANIVAIVLAVGALGGAAYGLVDALGKASASSRWILDPKTGIAAPQRRLSTLYTRFRGLPYVGFTAVQASIALVAPALKTALGEDYHQIVREQYRDGRGAGLAPTSLRQGVRLGLTLMSPSAAAEVIDRIWGMRKIDAARLAAAIGRAGEATPGEDGGPDEDEADRLMGLFLTAWDARVEAAFAVAEQRYQAAARGWAAATALGLACGLNGLAVAAPAGTAEAQAALPWPVAILVGLVAVPLAPVAKDLASSLTQAMDAFKAIKGGR